jgi:hypothetical protein
MHMTCKQVEHEGIPRDLGNHPDMVFGGKAEFIDHIRREIDAGRPLIGFGIIGPPEACVIAGYREEGEALTGWSFLQSAPELAGSHGNTAEGYFLRRGWFEHVDTIMVLSVGELGALPDPRALARETMALALEVMAPYWVRERAGGQEAFDRWAAAIAKDEEFFVGAPLHQLMGRMICMMHGLTMVAEGRWYAHKWTRRIAPLFPEAAAPLDAAAAGLKDGHELIWKAGALLGGIGIGEKQARELAKPDVRRKCVTLILQAKDKDRVVMEKYREALGLIGSG